MNEKILLCPFCGGTSITVVDCGDTHLHRCDICGAITQSDENIELVRQAWKWRVEESKNISCEKVFIYIGERPVPNTLLQLTEDGKM